MPDRVAENLVMFISQNNGTLSKKRREGEFKKLREEEVTLIEAVVHEAFEGFDQASGRNGIGADTKS
jgi:hypothetical protein